MARSVSHPLGGRSYWHFAAIAVAGAAPVSRAAFIASLDGVSNSSTFENATAASSPTPTGWTAVGSPAIRAFKGSGSNAIMIASGSTSTANYTSQYDTGIAIRPDTIYTLSTEIGFASTATPGSGVNGYAVILGELSAGVFTPLAADNSTTPYQYNANTIAPYYSGQGSTQFTTGAAVDGQDVAVQLVRTSPDGTAWLGFDNVTLDATKVPEPAAGIAIAAAVLSLRRRRSA